MEHVQGRGDFADAQLLAFKGEGGGARGDAQAVHLREYVRHRVADAMCQESLAFVLAEVREGQYGDGPVAEVLHGESGRGCLRFLDGFLGHRGEFPAGRDQHQRNAGDNRVVHGAKPETFRIDVVFFVQWSSDESVLGEVIAPAKKQGEWKTDHEYPQQSRHAPAGQPGRLHDHVPDLEQNPGSEDVVARASENASLAQTGEDAVWVHGTVQLNRLPGRLNERSARPPYRTVAGLHC